MTAKKIALFIDADNISAKFGKQIFDALERRGEIFIRRIYGNWEKLSLHGWNDCILSCSLRAVQQPDFATGKNATDMSLTIDAMDVLHEGKAEVFALVSNDSDFTPLAIRLREGGMNVIGLGSAQVSNSFRAACSEFIDLSAQIDAQPVQPPPKVVKKFSSAQEKFSPVQLSLFDEDKVVEPETPPATSKVVPITSQVALPASEKNLQALHAILRETAALRGDDKGFVPMCWAGQALREKNLGFGVKDFGYGSLNKFVAAFPDLYEMIQRDSGENFCYRCRNVGQKILDDSDRLKRLHAILHEAAEIYGNDEGFSLLNSAGQAIKRKNLGYGVKDFGYNQLRDFVSDFPDLYEVKDTGTTIAYRCLDGAPKNPATDDDFQQVHDVLREVAAAYTDLDDADGYTALNRAGLKAHERKLDIKNFGYSSWSKFVSDFPNRYAVKKVGSLVYYRCR